MALIFDDIAICGLGMSCQTAMQLDENAEYLEQVLGQKAIRKSTPFDWIISGPRSIARMIEEGQFFPHDLSEIAKGNYAMWRDMGVLYPHEKHVGSRFIELSEKWAHLADNFASITSTKTKIFVLSNTQNNLYTMGDTMLPPGWADLSDETLKPVRDALEERFGQVALHCVVYADRHSMTPSAPADAIHTIEPDMSPVRGDRQAWRGLFQGMLSPLLTRCAR